jgi:hypothetical protein
MAKPKQQPICVDLRDAEGEPVMSVCVRSPVPVDPTEAAIHLADALGALAGDDLTPDSDSETKQD